MVHGGTFGHSFKRSSARISGMLHGHYEAAVRLLSYFLRLQAAGKWRDVSESVDGIGFLNNSSADLRTIWTTMPTCVWRWGVSRCALST